MNIIDYKNYLIFAASAGKFIVYFAGKTGEYKTISMAKLAVSNYIKTNGSK